MPIGGASLSIATTKLDLLNSLRDREFRSAFNLENVYTTVCFQLRALREQRGMSQLALGRSVEPTMAQERISILEDPNAKTKPTLSTLLRLADGLDIGLEVRFVPFSKVLHRATHTDMRELEVKSFETEAPEVEREVQREIETEKQIPALELAWVREGATGASNEDWQLREASAGKAPKKEPGSEHNSYYAKGEWANAARVGAIG